ncbi:hypothetical protein R3P38DRAFT_3260322 [Favolaschia claudopus]|uniref:Uncharacterized protein n=1 Tax=Favolaschia claudopus TaxID=2862362 RepID=A0AAW0CTG8_9AGAR
MTDAHTPDIYDEFLQLALDAAFLIADPDFSHHLAAIGFGGILQNATEEQKFFYCGTGEAALDKFLVNYLRDTGISFQFRTAVQTYVRSGKTLQALLATHWESIKEGDALDLIHLFIGVMFSTSETPQARTWVSQVFSPIVDAIVWGYQRYLGRVQPLACVFSVTESWCAYRAYPKRNEKRSKLFKRRANHLCKVADLLCLPPSPPMEAPLESTTESSTQSDPYDNDAVLQTSPSMELLSASKLEHDGDDDDDDDAAPGTVLRPDSPQVQPDLVFSDWDETELEDEDVLSPLPQDMDGIVLSHLRPIFKKAHRTFTVVSAQSRWTFRLSLAQGVGECHPRRSRVLSSRPRFLPPSPRAGEYRLHRPTRVPRHKLASRKYRMYRA